MSATNPRQRRKLTQLPEAYWSQPSSSQGIDVASLTEAAAATPVIEAATISGSSTCATCGGASFETFLQQRAHFATDVHKYNARRRARGRHAVSEDEFHRMDVDEVGSISGSDGQSEDDEDDGEEEEVRARARARARASGVKVEFFDPVEEEKFTVVYKVALPDEATLESLGERGGWAIIMSGGGHFAAAVWDKAGELMKSKTFHRYTSRAKQGGSQAVADSQGGKRIRSAGATLRRHGEQQLQNEVRALLTSWSAVLGNVQCVYVRANMRERRDLLVGWEGSPLAPFASSGRVRNIPFPTRRATFNEAKRCYEELMTAVTSPTSSLQLEVLEKESVPSSKGKEASSSASATKVRKPEVPKEKGTSHLKKREDKLVDASDSSPNVPVVEVPPPPPPPPLHANLLKVVLACVEGEIACLSAALIGDEPEVPKDIVFHCGYFEGIPTLSDAGDASLGLVGVASVAGCVPAVTWLVEAGAPLSVGASPYLTTKSKAARTALRRCWTAVVDDTAAVSRLGFEAAAVPGPLTAADDAAAAEKRKKERAKKKKRKEIKDQESLPPEVRARQARAAAAEKRAGLGVSVCAQCGKSLAGIVPFEKLEFKYCSTTCVAKHREKIVTEARAGR